jgi:hypothetical protein
MKIKKILATFLSAVCLAGAASLAMAADTAGLTITSGSTQAGQSVTLTVGIENNPGIAATLVYIYYDTSVFTVDPSEDISAAGSFRSSGGLIGNSIEKAKNGLYRGDSDKDGVLALWYNGSGLNTTGDGALLTVTLHAAESAASGDYTVSLGYSPDDTCNQSGDDVTLTMSTATVTVTGGGTGTSGSDAGSGSTDSTVTGSTGTDSTDTDSTDTVSDSGPVGGTEDTETAETTETVTFSDVSGHWAEDYIMQAAQLGLVEGYDGKYRPDNSMTRAEFVTILWRSKGSPSPTKSSSFTDLTQDWYLDAVAWAEEQGVVNGVGGGKFDPTGPITRQQLVTTLYRLAGKPVGMEVMLTSIYDSQYPDSDQIGSWAKSALYWSIYHDIYCGEASVSVGESLTPTNDADRAQIAVMMVRYLDQQ